MEILKWMVIYGNEGKQKEIGGKRWRQMKTDGN